MFGDKYKNRSVRYSNLNKGLYQLKEDGCPDLTEGSIR